MNVGDLVKWKGDWGAGDDDAIGIIVNGPNWDEKYTVYWLYSDYCAGLHCCLERCLKVIK
jgi:hypothetical protein